MNHDGRSRGRNTPQPGAWRDNDNAFSQPPARRQSLRIAPSDPDAEEQSGLLQLLGVINFKILSGNSLYIEVSGTAYKILYGAYWRGVYDGAEHYLLKCEEIARGMWMEGDLEPSEVDLSIRYSNDGWLVQGHSLKFVAYKE